MAKHEDIPQFGNLSDLKVVIAGVSTAAPFAGSLFASNGADVIQIEPPKGVDPYRWTNDGVGVQNEHKNMRSLMIDVVSEKGRAVFMKLIKTVDIFIEASRGGQWAKWGITDEVLWEQNPKLVIGHMSGYGLSGDEKYVSRPGYDHTICAFSGIMDLNGEAGGMPILPQKFMTDYYAGLLAYGSSLAAYIKAQTTGKGDSFDLAQFEVATLCQGGQYGLWFEKQQQVPRGFGAPKDLISAGTGYYECKDGYGVYLFPNGPAISKKFITFLGLEYGSELFPQGAPSVALNSPGAAVFEEKIAQYCATHTAAEMEEELSEVGIPCAKIMNYAAMENHPHYLARETWTEWDTVDGKKFKGTNLFPRFKNNPGEIWRGCPSIGMDNDDILDELGVDETEKQSLYDEGILRKSDYVGGLPIF